MQTERGPADTDDLQKLLQKMNHPAYLHTVSMRELYENVYPSKPPIIDNLLYMGTYLFVGAPKVGKSFLMAQLAYHVSTGTSLWEYNVRKGAVLYLALEDDYRRLQERLFRMFGINSTEKLHFAIGAKQLDGGLEAQLQKFIQDYPDTKLIIIDTLQKILEAGGIKCLYGSDYDVVGKLKQFADKNQICLLLVHHTRKQQADDKFDMISGTNGLMGAADGAFLLYKEKRTSLDAMLDISGRDQQDQRLYLTRNAELLIWELSRTETEPWNEPPDSMILAITNLLSADQPIWSGSPTALVNTLKLEIKPNILTMKLNINAGRLLQDYHIRYENSRRHAGRRILLALDTSEA